MTKEQTPSALLKARELVDWMKVSKGKPCHRAVVDSFPSIVAEIERLHAENAKVTNERDEEKNEANAWKQRYEQKQELYNRLIAFMLDKFQGFKTLEAENERVTKEMDELKNFIGITRVCPECHKILPTLSHDL